MADSRSDRCAYDVLVVGAGPAGIASALTLHNSGVSVAVVDKATFPRQKICGDGLTTGALRLMEQLDIDLTAIDDLQQIHDVELRSPKGRTVNYSLPTQGVFAAVVPRMSFDAHLVDHARAQGIEIFVGEAVEALTTRSDDVLITTTARNIRARHVIAADGMWSTCRKLLGGPQARYLGDLHAFRQYVSNVSDAASSRLFVSFEPDILPGYFWSFPLPNGRANIGYGILRGHGPTTREMKELWPNILRRPHIARFLGSNTTTDEAHQAWPIPARIGELPLSIGRTFFVGDALGACDVLTGEGIGQAFQSGILAAEIIAGSSPNITDKRDDYRRRLAYGLGRDHRMSSWLSRGLSTVPSAELAISITNSNDWTKRNFVRWLFEDYPRGIAFSPRTWKPYALRQPGPYQGANISASSEPVGN